MSVCEGDRVEEREARTIVSALVKTTPDYRSGALPSAANLQERTPREDSLRPRNRRAFTDRSLKSKRSKIAGRYRKVALQRDKLVNVRRSSMANEREEILKRLDIASIERGTSGFKRMHVFAHLRKEDFTHAIASYIFTFF